MTEQQPGRNTGCIDCRERLVDQPLKGLFCASVVSKIRHVTLVRLNSLDGPVGGLDSLPRCMRGLIIYTPFTSAPGISLSMDLLRHRV